ncbi:hypothetical protein FACS1894109_16800 [Spirochaetia bacterium]|nr:hypothetical protein FACS1894109_16800 [Spirochaetia bacterium]
MPRLTEAEYDALDEEITRNPPDIDPAKARRPVRMIMVDDLCADWLRIKAAAEHTTETAIIGELVRKELAAQSA